MSSGFASDSSNREKLRKDRTILLVLNFNIGLGIVPLVKLQQFEKTGLALIEIA
jgi:hypothetical protein